MNNAEGGSWKDHDSIYAIGHGWRRLLSRAAAFALFIVAAFALSGCGGGGGSSTALPGVPTAFAIAPTASGVMSETLTWSPPASGGTPTSYEVYRSTTAGTAFDPANKITSIAAVSGQTKYTFVDNTGLSPTTTYWAVSAKNAAGETPTGELSDKPTGDTVSLGNNFSAALIFADDIGITGSAIPSTSVWTTNAASAVAEVNTGLRPLSTDPLPSTATTLPYLDPTTAYLLDGVTYYPQKSSSTWQGQWELGASKPQHVTAKWGDNLVSQSLSSTSKVRIEVGLSEALTTPMTSYTMKSLYGTKVNEVQGTDGTTYENSTATVFASNAHLTIQKVGEAAPLVDQTLWLGDGPGFFAGEINVSGNFTYGFIWDLKSLTVPYSKTGTWRLTFSLDPTSPKGTPNNTVIDAAANGVLDSPSQVHIDVNVQ